MNNSIDKENNDKIEYKIDTPLPYYAEEYLLYMDVTLNKSANTLKEYRYDLIMFFTYMHNRKKLFKEIADYDETFIRSVKLADFYAFEKYLKSQRNEQSRTIARKVSCLKSFFKYLLTKAKIIDVNPAAELESPKIPKNLPVYLELNESRDLLKSVEGENELRDYCILTLFLNCGMRVSELAGINISSIKDDHLTVHGKGDKERTVYLNNACIKAIDDYLKVRPDLDKDDPSFDALFLSERKQRMSIKTIQYNVKKYITKAGLDPTKYTTHKLRHTAATLMYLYGDVDIRSLQEILGHESVATTEIYTHVNKAKLAEAVKNNPLANEEKD